jgi:SPP1 family predicted phage head-tail adaptor
MRIGKLRTPVTIQKQVGNVADFGLSTNRWEDFETTWASVSPLNGQDQTVALQIDPTLTHRVMLRANPSRRIKPSMRVLVDDRTLEIKTVLTVDERGAELSLLCVERLENA